MRSSVAQIKNVTPMHSKGNQYTSQQCSAMKSLAWVQKVLSMTVIKWSPISIPSPYTHFLHWVFCFCLHMLWAVGVHPWWSL